MARGGVAGLRALGRLAAAPFVYARIAWWGLAAPRVTEREPLVIAQAVVRNASGEVLLAVRSDLQGWELPGGTPHPGEALEDALRREVLEETGVEVALERRIGDYVRTGFRPHTARVWLCRATGGAPRTSRETLDVRWFAIDALPATLLPWYRAPLADGLSGPAEPVVRLEHQGASSILAGLAIDLRTRARGPGA